jgi:hypothetical protein
MSNADDFDVGAELAPAGPLAALRALADEASALDEEIEAIESLLEIKKAEMTEIKTIKMPKIMIESGVPLLDVGLRRFELQKFVSGKLPEEEPQRTTAIEKLMEYEGGGIITADVTVQFGRGDHNAFVSLREELKERGFAVTADTEKVHASSYCAFLRRRLEDGKDIDADIMNVHFGDIVKINKVPKALLKKRGLA